MSEPKRPDIDKDRIYLVTGATLIGAWAHVRIVDQRAWITKVPVEEAEGEREADERLRAEGKRLWPRESHFSVAHQLKIGTVAELTEDYRNNLTAAFNTWTMAGVPDGPDGPPVMPAFGTTDLAPQNAVLERNGITALTTLPGAGAELQAREDRRSEIRGGPMRQDGVSRDLLEKLVALWRSHVLPEGGLDGGPTDNPVEIDRLIAALTVFGEDAQAAAGERESAP